MRHDGQEIRSVTATANQAARLVRFNSELTDAVNHNQPPSKHLAIMTDPAKNDVITGKFSGPIISGLATWSDQKLRTDHSIQRNQIEAAMLHLMKTPVFDAVSSEEANKNVTDPEKLQVVFSDLAVGVKFQMSADRLLTDLSSQKSPFTSEQTEKALQYLVVADAAISSAGLNHVAAPTAQGAAEAELSVSVMTRAGLPVVVTESALLKMSGWGQEDFASTDFTPAAVQVGLADLQRKTFPQPAAETLDHN